MSRMSLSRVALVVVVGSFAGCFDVSVPDGVLIVCGDDGTCPDPLTCESATNLCVRAVGDELAPPTATGLPLLVGGPFLDDGAPITVGLTFEAAPLGVPTVDLVKDDVVVASFDVSGADTDFAASLTTSRDLLAAHEGRLAVVVTAVDGRGLPKRFAVGFVDVDVTPPVIGNVSLQRLPDPRLTPVAFDIADAVAVGPNVDVRLAFSVNENLSADAAEAPTARLDGSPLPLTRNGEVANPVTFDVDWSDLTGVVDGSFDIAVRVVDEAGNAVEEVVGTLVVDVTAPAAPAVDVAGNVVFERAPWGRAEAAGPDVFTVVGAAASVAAGDFVIVTRDAEGLREIGRTRADDDGFGGIGVAGRDDFFLATGDIRDVFVVVADGAGNVSSPVKVKDTRWIASPGGKVIGDDLSNPHHFEELPIFLPQLAQSAVVERGAADGVGSVDSDAVVTDGAGTFTAKASDDGDALNPAAGVLVGSAVGHDPVRGLTVIYGGSQSKNSVDEGPVNANNTACISAVDDIWVRRGDGRFRRLSLPATATRPPPMSKAHFVFDTRRNTLVLVGIPDFSRRTEAPEMWSFDGAGFTQLCTDAACVASTPGGLQNMGLAADPVRHVLVAHGGNLGAETFEFDGSVWRAVCGDGCAEASAGPGGLVYDDVNRRVVWFDGTSLAAWDGTTWTPLCTDDACIASAPPARSNTTAAWDRRRHKLVTFGGDNPGGSFACDFGSQTFPRNGVPDDVRAAPPFADTWEFDGTTWAQVTTTNSPPSRSLHQMAWDERAQAVLVVGGDDCNCNQNVRDPGFRNQIEQDAWEFDGADWRRVDVAPSPPPGFARSGPVPLAFHTLVPSTGSITGSARGVLASGDLANPMLLIDDGRFYSAPVSPTGNTFLSPVADDDNGDLFVLDGGTPFAFIFDGTSTQPVCSPDPTCGGGGTPPFFGYAAAHDGDRLVVFGGARNLNNNFGASFSDTAIDETFTFDATNGLRQRCADGSCGPVPGRRVRGRLSKTSNRGEVLLFGGAPGDDGTWIFSGNTWTQQTTTTTPGRRQDLILTFDPERDAVMMTGGTDDNPSNDTRGSLPERPLPDFLSIVYEWTGDWTEARVVDPEGDGRPSSRFAAAAAADPSGGITIQGGVPSPKRLFGGPPGGDRLADVWSWNGGSALQPAQRFRVTTAAAGLRNDDVITGATVRWFFGADVDVADVSLVVWDSSAWVDVVGVPCVDVVGVCVEASLDAALANGALNGPAKELIVAARGRANGPAPGYASVATNYVEVALATTRAP